MHYKVMINEFEGPLDLLLHLIKENNIDIYNIKIEEITEQYLSYIKSMKDLNLSIASEYLVMASELVLMKSKMLLPKKDVNKEEDDYEDDPKELLIQRLLNYKKYKEITNEFKELESTRKQFFTKEPSNLNYYATIEEKESDVSLNDLLNAVNELLKRKENEIPVENKITKKELSVIDKVSKIRRILNIKKEVNFSELFDVNTKEEVIVSFLSILELVKKNEIILTQDKNFNMIKVALKEGV